MIRPKALILLANGTNRDHDVAQALELAGATAEIVPLQALRQSAHPWKDYQMLVVAGGFSFADALGAGRMLALDLVHYFSAEATEFVAAGKPVIGICNGFQALVKSGLLPGNSSGDPSLATLTFNQAGHFECRWVTMKPISQVCLWTRGLVEPIECPVAHGEGRFLVDKLAAAQKLNEAGQIALVYTCSDGSLARGAYPANPNGSLLDIAGICNPAGNVLGLMPHPENHVLPFQHPRWARAEGRCSGLPLFVNGVKFANELG
jgi:phosphoribosylformylglycinamidine synthase subunit PurQ / glutaminase